MYTNKLLKPYEIAAESAPNRSQSEFTALRVSRRVLVAVLFAVGAAAVSSLVYDSVQPVVIGVAMYLFALTVLRLSGLGGRPGRRLFTLLFAVYWLISALTACFDFQFGDPANNGNSDALYFISVATDQKFDGMSLLETWTTLGENAGATIIWLKAYQMFGALGFEKGRYIGITINLTCVALSCVVGLAMVRAIFGDDISRLRRYAILCSGCGMFWLFASIHIRDAIVLLAVSLLALCWVRYLEYRRISDIFVLFVATVVAFFSFDSLRAEFVFVPLAMLLAGFTSIWFEGKSRTYRLLVLSAAMGCAAVAVNFVWSPSKRVETSLVKGGESYYELSTTESGSSSLGNKLVMGQPTPIRLLAGTIYLFVSPIPFWAGFYESSSYHILKSLNLLFMYTITPLLALSMVRLVQREGLRRSSLLFLGFLVTGFTLSVAYTSMESRHLAVFFIPLLILLLIPDLTVATERRIYGVLLGAYSFIIVLGHLAWTALKYGTGA